MKKKRSDVPLFLLYAGIIHAIGLALLLPMLITLPGPDSAPAPKAPVFDVIVLPAPETLVDVGPEHTSALPLRPQAREERTTEAAPPEAERPGLEQEAKETITDPAPAAESQASQAPQQPEPSQEPQAGDS